MLVESLLFLTAVINSTFYVSVPNNTRDAFVCFDHKDIWPITWVRLKESNQEQLKYNLDVYEAPYDRKNKSNFLVYKLKFFLFDGSLIETDKWNTIYIGSQNATLTKTVCPSEETAWKTSFIISVVLFLFVIILAAFLYLNYKVQ